MNTPMEGVLKILKHIQHTSNEETSQQLQLVMDCLQTKDLFVVRGPSLTTSDPLTMQLVESLMVSGGRNRGGAV